MINYSVYMLPNQMNKEEAPKAYAKAQVKEVMSFRQFVAHIAEHGGHKRGQVKGVLSDTCSCLVEQLLEGKKILLDDLGDFWISLTSMGAENCEAFTAKNITGVRIIFTPGEDFENLLGRASFNLVPSRVAQAATLKAEKMGENTVDLAAAKNKGTSNSSNNGSDTPTTPDDTPTGGSGSDGDVNDNPLG
ncbi:MAG: DNA-binding protein [Mediterranea sp.]|nr:DNA-binding protein [Mediterranea sp.]